VRKFIECWMSAASAIFSQAVAGEPELIETLPKPMPHGMFGYAVRMSGAVEGRFAVVLESSILALPLLGEGVDQKAAWGELLREVAQAAAGELLAKTGVQCRVEGIEETSGETQVTCVLQLKSATGAWTIMVHDETRDRQSEAFVEPPTMPSRDVVASGAEQGAISPGIELLLDVELDATLRFGCREMALSEILDLGAGDVVELDRHASDPVDLIVGDKIVARGEAVLVNGNFGLRVTEVATPRKRLESIRCLF
jgi:flagellar motor switch protein FliN